MVVRNDKGEIVLLASWLADCNLASDAELEAILLATMFEKDERWNNVEWFLDDAALINEINVGGKLEEWHSRYKSIQIKEKSSITIGALLGTID